MFVIGLDQGTTSTRAIAFDEKGTPIYIAQRPLRQIYPQPGWCEHDPIDILSSSVSVLEELVSKLPANTIAGVGITNQRETLIAWRRSTGQPLHNAIVWLDVRTDELIGRYDHMNRYRPITGLPVSSYFSALKIVWLIENVKEVKEAILEEDCCFGTVDAWLCFKLIGKFVTDATNASRYNLMRLDTLQWDPEICSLYDIPIHTLPQIVPSRGYLGSIIKSSLSHLKVTALIGDQQAALFGHRCVQPGNSKVTYGTGAFVLSHKGSDIPAYLPALLTTIAFLDANKEASFAYEGSVGSAGRLIDFLINLGIASSQEEFHSLAESVESSEGVSIVPAFSGLLAPHWRPDAKTLIYGMSLATTKAHICRAALEAIALQIDQVLSHVQTENILVDGGMTNSSLLMQIQADVLGRQLKVANFTEATAWGAALAAGSHLGVYNDLENFSASQGGYRLYNPKMSEDNRDSLRNRYANVIPRSFGL